MTKICNKRRNCTRERRKNNVNPKKPPEFNLITGEVLWQIPRKAVLKLTSLINVALRLKYVQHWGKLQKFLWYRRQENYHMKPHLVGQFHCCQVCLNSSRHRYLSWLFTHKNLTPNHQFGIRYKHLTVDQILRFTDIIEKALEEKKVCSTNLGFHLLDAAQAFDEVWHEGV